MSNNREEPKHVKFLSKEDQEKWLKQRGWIQEGPVMWEQPSSGLRYGFAMAMQKALEQCSLPADSTLMPVEEKRVFKAPTMKPGPRP